MADNTQPQYRPSLDIWNRNPVIIYSLVNAIVVAVSAFGLSMDGQQVGAIMAVVNILLALIYNSPLVSPAAATAQVNEALLTPAPAQSSTVVEVKKVEVED